MTYISISNQGKTYYLMEQPDLRWYFTDKISSLTDDTVVSIEFTAIDGVIVDINTDNQYIIDVLTNFIRTDQPYHGYEMLNYYPEVIKIIKEYQALVNAMGFEIDFLKCNFNLSFNDAFLTTMGEERVIQWERALGIVPSDDSTLADRRTAITARLQSAFKLNSNSIDNLVRTMSGYSSASHFKDSCIYVEINTPSGDRTVSFPEIESELLRRVPAHLQLNVTRKYATWRDVKNNLNSWKELYETFPNWDELKFHKFS